MPRCPNCFYELVLLEHRRKYKCPKCSKLFFQKDIENKEFVEWNKRQRKADKEAFNGKPQKQKILTEFEKKQMRKAYYEKNKERLLRDKALYYLEHRDEIIQQKREYRKSLGGQKKKEQNEKRKARRWQNIENIRVNLRIEYWRRRQKQLTLLQLENEFFKAYNMQLQRVLPTFALSEQLLI